MFKFSSATIRHPVLENPTIEQRRRHRGLSTPQNKMLIMGYFGAWNEPYNSEEEKVLCEIDVLGQRILRITPDQGMHSIDSNIGHYQYHLSIQSFVEFDRIGILDDEEDQLSTATDQMEESQFDFNLPGKDAIYLQYMVCIGLFKDLKGIQSYFRKCD
jgi:hypothetical protein